MFVAKENAIRDYRRWVPITDNGFDALISALVQSPVVQAKWRELPHYSFIQWAGAKLCLGLASAYYLDNKLKQMLS